MKAEVITIFDNNNYGSMLQTYATQTLLARYGVEAEFVDYIRPHMTDEAKIQERLKKSKYSNPIALWLIRRRKAKALKDASSIFRGFLKDKINLTDRTYYSFEEICKNPPAADFYCTGSDQTWNSSWNQGIDRSFFLSFAPEEKPKISFSASVGKTDISDDERDEMVRLWKQYAYITVREESAEKLLRSVGIEAHIVLDPTLMLTKTEWERIASQRVKNEPYILVYQLHRKHQYVKFEEYVETLKAKTGLKVVKICFSNEMKGNADFDIVLPKVEEYLSLIMYADLVISDSFHATSFAINLHTDFEVILPDAFSTRIENILDITGLQNRIVRSISQVDDCKTIDYENVEAKMEEARTKSLKVIESALVAAGVKGLTA